MNIADYIFIGFLSVVFIVLPTIYFVGVYQEYKAKQVK